MEAIKSATEGLVTASQTFGQRLYDAAAQDAAAAGGGSGPSGADEPDDDEVVEAEIVDEGDEPQSA